MESIKVFVYGTLKCGYFNHMNFLYNRDGVQFVGNAETVNELTMYDLGPYPFVVMSRKGGSVIKGELYEITPDVLADLDHLEGYPEMYNRTVVPVVLENGYETTAWIYTMKTGDRKSLLRRTPKVASGLWRDGVLEIKNMEEEAGHFVPYWRQEQEYAKARAV